jgi:hypothetical protein
MQWDIKLCNYLHLKYYTQISFTQKYQNKQLHTIQHL